MYSKNEYYHRSPTQEAFRRLRGNRIAVASAFVLAFITLACVLGPWISPYGYAEQDLLLGAEAPSLKHWFGTDLHGRDLLTRVLYGGRVSLMVGVVATAVALVIGVGYGALAGYRGGRLEDLMMRGVDILYALPFTLFVILLVSLYGRSLWLIFAAIGMVEWLTMARIVRGQVRTLRHQAYVEAARALGRAQWGILRAHLLPNLWGPIIVYATLTVPNVILLESFISFLGLGVQPPQTSWGDLISQGASAMLDAPWQLLFPSLAFASTLFALNFLGDGLRDAFDSRRNQH